MDHEFNLTEEETFIHDAEGDRMDSLPNDHDKDFTNAVDHLWMLSESDEWSVLQNSTQNASEILDKLEETVSRGFDKFHEKISGIDKKEDLEKAEKLLLNFKSRWAAKCKETENLRVSLKRATHESTRINDDYNEMQVSVSKMRKQFGQAIDSSVTEIEELSICNNSLSERIHELESKIIRGDRAFKRNAKDNLDSLRKIIDFTSDADGIKSIQTKLKKEADRIDRMIVVEDLFGVDKTQTASNLAEKSKKMVDAIAQGLVETLKRELFECRNIVDSQGRRIKDLEREKEEFLENQLALKHDGVNEMNELIEYLRKSVLQRKTSSDDEDSSDLNIIKRNFNGVRQIIRTIKDGLVKSYKSASNKTSEIIDLKDNISEINQQLKEHASQTEDLLEEKSFLKTKIEHIENQHRLAIEELNAIQKRLNTVDEERKQLYEENLDLKGGKENMNEFCSNLSGENDKLLNKLKNIQSERDKLFNDLQENLHRISVCSSENNELESKCENLEHAIAKIRREYQDQTRETNILTRENEELKNTLQDNEQERLKLRRSMKSVEVGNKDLEDQIFQLRNDQQKTKNEYEKLKRNNEENIRTIQELTINVDKEESEKMTVETELKDAIKARKELEDTNKTLCSEVNRDKEITDKRNTLLKSYEKLLIKLLHQRKEMLKVSKLNGTNTLQDIVLQVSSAQSIDFKNISDIETSIKRTAEEVDTTYNSIKIAVDVVQKDNERYENFFRELTEYFTDDETNDSCYSTEGDIIEPYIPGRDVGDGRRGLDALKAPSFKARKNEYSLDVLSALLSKIKNSLSKSKGNLSDECETIEVSRKWKTAMKKIQQLQVKLKNRKILEQSLRKKLSHSKKEIKVLKQFHRSFHGKANNNQLSPKRSPIQGLQPPFQKDLRLTEILEDLKNTKEELESVRQVLKECTDKNCSVKLETNFDKIGSSVNTLREKLSSSRFVCTCGDTKCKTGVDELDGKLEVISEQRQYMLDHLTFTNKRLEVLLDALKGRKLKDYDNDLPAENTELNTRPVLKQVRDSLKKDQDAMKRAVSILELTKAISITDLTELQEHTALNEEHRDVIVLVKNMNDNMESALREARSKIVEPGLPGNIEVTDENTESSNKDTKAEISEPPADEFVPKSELLKKENELKISLESAQKKVETLSQFLEKREEELKERDVLIAKLNKEYEKLKLQTNDKTDTKTATRDRMIEAYKNANQKLEKENEFLQVVVKEVRQELLNLQRSFKKEEDTQQHLQEFINELKICKSTLEHSLDKMAYELNIVKKDRDHLLRIVHGMGMQNSYQNYYQYPHMYNSLPYNHMDNGYHQNGSYYPDCQNCEMCAYQDFSESTTFPFSEEEWDQNTSVYGDFDSLPSDGEHQEDVVSSSESQTSSRVAKTITTLEATESIKSKNRPAKYLNKESRTRKHILSPKSTSRRDPFEGLTPRHGDATPSSRVLGRREMSIHGKDYDANTRRGSQGSVITITSQKQNSRRNSHNYDQPISNYDNSRSSDSTGTLSSQKSNSRRNSGDNKIRYQNPVFDIDHAINMASEAEQSYNKSREKHSPRSPHDQLATPFLNPNYDVKKRKKKFLPSFGKK